MTDGKTRVGIEGSGNTTAIGKNIAIGPFARVDRRFVINLGLYERGRDRPARVADELAAAVERRWRGELEYRSLHHPDPPLPVSWAAAEEGLVAAWDEIVNAARGSDWEERRAPVERWASAPGELAGADGLAAVVLEQVPTCRLIVLGDPGAGKTSLLARMSLHILERRRRDGGVPIPVVLPLATWNPGTQPNLWQWMAERIAAEYVRLSDHDVDELHRNHRILPVLDGLDEIPEQVRTVALARINDALWPGHYLVVSCREQEYGQVVHPEDGSWRLLSVAAGVTLSSPAADEVAAYLHRDEGGARDRWRRVLVLTESGRPVPAHVVEALSRPLTIDLARTVYNRAADRAGEPPPDPVELLDRERFPDKRSIEDHLFTSYLQAAYISRAPGRGGRTADPDGPVWRLDQVRKWLRFLARFGTDTPRQAATSLEWWRLREEVPPGLIGAVLGAAPAAAVGLVAAVNPRLGSGLGVGLLTGLLAGVLLLFLGSRRPGAEGGVRGRAPARTGIAAGIAGGFVGGVAGGALGGLLGVLLGVQHSAIAGIMGGLGVGVGTGASFGPWKGMGASFCGGAALGLCAGFWPGVPAGVLDGLGAWFSAGVTIELKGVREPARGLSRVSVGPTAVVMMVAGSAIGLLAAVRSGTAAGILTGLVVGLFGGVAAGVEGDPADLTSAIGPRAVLARDRRVFLLVGVLGGISFGVGAATGVTPEVGMAGGLTVGLVAASVRASWGPYLVARSWLALRGRLPWRLMTFLDDAHTHRNVLRQVGAAYQFRHVELQDHLAKPGAD